jgi:hypothetical protein
MERFPKDIYTEPAELDPDTLANLGPLRWMAGVWEGAKGVDVHPVAGGSEEQAYLERIELQPIDPQTNGPQLLYGLRYHEFIVKPGEVQTFHDQIGYWLWEPASETVTQTVAIPRAQTAMASGRAAADARSFELVATRGSTSFGICSSPFLEYAFRTIEYRIRVVVHDENRWSYDEDTLLVMPGASEPFHHTDRNTLTRIAAATPNPMMRR